MATIEDIRSYGADTDAAVARLLGNEEFYLRLIPKIFEDKNFEKLFVSIENNDLDKAFEAAHSLKGVLGNLELTPILNPVVEITELLRAKTDTDYKPYLEEIARQRSALEKLF